MRLINVTNSYRHLVNQQLNATDARLVKVFSLGRTTVILTEAKDHIELLLTNDRRNIQQAEIAFALDRILHLELSDVEPIISPHLAEISISRLRKPNTSIDEAATAE